jgi:L-malate glycosyltransferase
VRGGYPFWGLLPTVAHSVRVAAARGKPVMLWGVGVDTITTPVGKWMTRQWIRKADVVTVRDRRSHDRLATLGFRENQLSLAADPVFDLPRCDRTEARRFARRAFGVADDTTPLVLFSPANDRRTGLAYLGPLIAGCRTIVSRHGGTLGLFLMDHQPRYDLALMDVPGLKADDVLVHGPLIEFSPSDISMIFAGVDLVISSRMHALILAATQGTPWVNIARSAKMEALSERFGQTPLRTSNLNAGEVVQRVDAAISLGPGYWQKQTDRYLRVIQERVATSRRLFEERIVRV